MGLPVQSQSFEPRDARAELRPNKSLITDFWLLPSRIEAPTLCALTSLRAGLSIISYPIVWTDVLTPYGTTADPGKPIAVFGALSYWWFGEHGAPRMDTSDHVFFQNDQLAVRFIEEISNNHPVRPPKFLDKNSHLCCDYPMRAGDITYRAHAAGLCPVLPSDLRTAVSNRVRHTGRPLPSQTLRFMRTIKPREGNGGPNNRIFRFLFL
jgi:hypothetical protein